MVSLMQARQGLGNLLIFLTLLSANLAVINFLPIPVLDGGHFVLLLYEGIRGKPADERVQEILTWIGLIFLLSLMVFVFGLDFGLISRPH
jgi:regulator of sigma E protease